MNLSILDASHNTEVLPMTESIKIEKPAFQVLEDIHCQFFDTETPKCNNGQFQNEYRSSTFYKFSYF